MRSGTRSNRRFFFTAAERSHNFSCAGALLGKKSLDAADEVRSFEKGRLEIVTVNGHTMGRATFEPGWKWSECIKPIAQTDLCEAQHLGYVVSGRMHVVMSDGSQAEFGPGDAMHLGFHRLRTQEIAPHGADPRKRGL